MEVHHHPQLNHGSKKFKEYFLEFLMIFLAVSMGFFAESLRENITNKEKEKHYIESLVRDLKIDTLQATVSINDQNFLLSEMDSAFQISTDELRDLNKQDIFFHHFLYFFNEEHGFKQHDITLIQLRNTGGYSVIHRQGVADSIISLVSYYSFVTSNEDFYYDDFIKVEDFTSRLIKIPYIPTEGIVSIYPKLLHQTEVFTQYDKPLLEQLYSLIHIEQIELEYYREVIRQYKVKATKLIAFLQKEYNLEDE